MKNLKQLRDERAEKIEAMRSLNDLASNEKRSFTEEEKSKFDALDSEIDALDQDIARAEKLEQRSREFVNSGNATPTGEQKEIRQYSLIKAVRGLVNGKVEGFELEMHQEAEKEAREHGLEIKNFGIPSIVLEGRANSVTQGTQPADGAQLLKNEEQGMITLLKDALVTRSLGARYISGLKGNVNFDKITQGATSTWQTEVSELAESTLKFASAAMAPKRLGTYSVVSKQLLAQSSYDIEQMIRQELMESIAAAVDKAAINGSGAANEPMGVLNTSGIGSVAIGANGGAPTYDHIVGLEAAIDAQNALLGNLKYLINTKTKAKLKTTKIDAGSGQFVLPAGAELNGYGFIASNMVPSNLTKGTGTDLSAILYGNWNDLIIGQWGGLDLMADPYTLATSGRVKLIVDSFWDVFVRRAQSFAAIKDAVTTL
jgi:HK97 family phage major capsid protein